MAAPAHLQAAASQFHQYYFHRSAITASSLTSPSYLTLMASYPLPQPPQTALSHTTPLPKLIQRNACAYNLIAAVSSEPSIKLYNYSHGDVNRGASLEHFAQLKGHTQQIYDIKFHNVHSSFDTASVETANGACMLSSCGQDGTVRFWDVRTQQAAITLRHPKNKPFFSCASADNLLAAGSGPFLFLWDLRSSKQLAENEEFHTEDINQIAFHPLDHSTLFTGSEDGLLCEIKPEDPDQDEWLQNVINIENPLSRFGFFGPKAEYVWALSCVETLSLWHIENCERVSDFSQIRDALSVSAHMPIDYLIDAHYDQKSQRVFLAAGCNSGELIMSHVNKSEIQPFCLAHVQNKPQRGAASATTEVSPITGFAMKPLANESPFALSSLQQTAPVVVSDAMDSTDDAAEHQANEFLQFKDGEVVMNDASMDDKEGGDQHVAVPINANDEGHTATIRDVMWFDNAVITCGEDSRLCLWTTQQLPNAANSSGSLKVKQHTTTDANGKPISMASEAPASDNSNKNNRQFKPY